MIVFKFGGASLKNAAAIKNVAGIIQSKASTKLVVVSAIGKTTDSLEKIVTLARGGKSFTDELSSLRAVHTQLLVELNLSLGETMTNVNLLFQEVENEASKEGEYDLIYDQVVSLGEVISSVIVYGYLHQLKADVGWLDARKIVATNNQYREAKVDWTATKENALLIPFNREITITQGFMGRESSGNTTTLGREGSDYTAAIFANALHAKSVTIWKDVPGVMNADPKKIKTAKIFEELPYREAAEMTYYGASIIHPKTIKPLANLGIPLFVKSFIDPALPGTIIHDCRVAQLPPLIAFKENQCLISCKVTDYSFINEEQLGGIFQTLADTNVKINVMQNSAISLSFCVDFNAQKILRLIALLSQTFEVYYNTGLVLITLKNYDAKLFQEYRSKRGILLEQSSRSTLQLLIKM